MDLNLQAFADRLRVSSFAEGMVTYEQGQDDCIGDAVTLRHMQPAQDHDGQTGESVKLRHVQRAPGHDEHTGDGGKLSKMQPASGHAIGLDAAPINMQRSNSASGFTLASTASGAITVNDGQTGESVKLRHVQRAPGHDEHTGDGGKLS